MDELDHLLFQQCDVITRKQALAFYTPDAIKHKLAVGRWQRPPHGVRGVYVLRPSDNDEQRRWIAHLSAPAGAVTAGRTALAQAGLRGFQVWGVHLLVPTSANRYRNRDPGVIVHYTRHLPAGDVCEVASPPRTETPRSVIDAANWAGSDNDARTLIAAAFQQRLVDAADLKKVLSRRQRMRRGKVIRQAISDAAAGVHSLPEAEFLAICRHARLPKPQLQVKRRTSGGKTRYLDALFAGFGVHVEIDGAQHMEVKHWWADMQRQNELWIGGERVLRFPSWAIRNKPREVRDTVIAALQAAGWAG